jgi:hypothetical protein
MGDASGTDEGNEKRTQDFGWETCNDDLEDPRTYGRIIIRSILNKMDGKAWKQLISQRTVTTGELLLAHNEPSDSIKGEKFE